MIVFTLEYDCIIYCTYLTCFYSLLLSSPGLPPSSVATSTFKPSAFYFMLFMLFQS